LEEDVVEILHKLKSTIFELLLYHLQSKYPLKSQGDIQDIALSKQNGYLNEDEWKTIVTGYLFSGDEAKLVVRKIQEFIRKMYSQNRMEEGKKLTREELQTLSKVKEDLKINYQDFVKVR